MLYPAGMSVSDVHEPWIDALLAWFDPEARPMPWRALRTPYRVWISETMLQQTQVATVIPYFERFMARFPDARALAAAPLEDVLKSWEGLGYYSRARALHRCAGIVVARYGGELPASHAALLELPGIGPYTAGAIASLAFGLPHPAVDGNVLRVTSRLWASLEPVDHPRTRERVTSRLASVMPDREPGRFNEALMELGATVCTPRNPRCEGCPMASHCLAFQAGAVSRFPVRAPRRKPRFATFEVAVLEAPGPRYLVMRRPDGGLLGGLWEFPTREISADETPLPEGPASGPSVPPSIFEALAPWQELAHAFTHIRATYRVGRARVLEVSDLDAEDVRWVTDTELTRLPLGKVHQLIRSRLLDA